MEIKNAKKKKLKKKKSKTKHTKRNMFGLSSQTGDETLIEACTPWMAAADGNLLLLQKSLEKLQIPFMQADENGFTVLHSAAAYNQTKILHWIILEASTYGSGSVSGSVSGSASIVSSIPLNINVEDSDGDTPLHHCENVEAAKVLIDAKADVSIRNKEGKTVLEVKEEEYSEIMEDENNDGNIDQMNLKVLIDYLKDVSKNANAQMH